MFGYRMDFIDMSTSPIVKSKPGSFSVVSHLSEVFRRLICLQTNKQGNRLSQVVLKNWF